MDVKDIQGAPSVPEPDGKSASVGVQVNGQTSAKSVSSGTSISLSSEPVKVTLEVKQREPEVSNSRDKANQAITALNVATEATKEIEKLVHSVGGILEQVTRDELSPQRKGVLEKEANELVSEIKRQAAVQAPDGAKPLSGDQIRVEIEEGFGKTLDVILPDEAKDAFGLGTIKFSPKESIINTVVHVAEAKARVENLRKTVDEARNRIAQVVDAADVAAQNSAAAKASVREVDAALKLAGEAKSRIASNPLEALGSVGSPSKNVLDLLRS